MQDTTAEVTTEELLRRLRALEDERAITRVLLSYGPSADAGLASRAGALWLEDGVYDWDAKGEPHQGSAGVERMLSGDDHQGLIGRGAAHFAGPLLVEVDGDKATALNYSLIMLRQEDRFNLWRVSAVRWDLERSGDSWRIRRRTNRLLDDSGAGKALLGDGLKQFFGDL